MTRAGCARPSGGMRRCGIAVGTTHGEEPAECREYEHDEQRELPTVGAISGRFRQWGHGTGLWRSPFKQLSVRFGAFPSRSLKLVNFPIWSGSVT